MPSSPLWKVCLPRLFFFLSSLLPASDILMTHCKLMMDLEERVQQWSDTQVIGDVFVANAESLKMYTTYVNNYEVALKTLAAAENKKSFSKFMKVRTRAPFIGKCATIPKSNSQKVDRTDVNKLDLPMILIMPIQRIPRYCLLINVRYIEKNSLVAVSLTFFCQRNWSKPPLSFILIMKIFIWHLKLLQMWHLISMNRRESSLQWKNCSKFNFQSVANLYAHLSPSITPKSNMNQTVACSTSPKTNKTRRLEPVRKTTILFSPWLTFFF